MAERIAGRFIKLGVLLVALGPIPALMGALAIVAIPGVAVATHVTMMAAGVMLMGLGLIWESRVRLDESRQRSAFWLVVVGAYGAVVTGFLAALVGIGGEALPAIVRDTIGSPGEELLVRLAAGVAGLLVVAGLGLIASGAIGDRSGARSEAIRDRVAARFIDLALLLPTLGVVLAVVTQWTPLALPVVTVAGLVILGVVSMGLGLVWDEVRLEDRLQPAASRLLIFAALGLLATGVFVSLSPEIADDALAGAYTGLFGSEGRAFVAQLGALVSVLALAVGIAVVWHGVPKSSARVEGALTIPVPEYVSARLRRLGALLLLLGAVSALLTSMSRLPRVSLGTAATVLILGPMLICFGLVWSRVRLGDGRQQTAFRVLWWGAFGILISGMVLGLLGIGGDTLSVSAAGHVGSPGAELVAKIAVDLSALLMWVGMLMVWFGVRGPAAAPSWRRRVARIAGYAIAILALEAVIYHVLPNALFGDAYPVQLMDYDAEEPGPVRVARIGEDGDLVYEDDPEYDDVRVQGWTPDEWQWFYHASQGGAFELPVPYDWIMSLEQPVVPLWPRSRVGLLMDPDYLARFGFLSNRKTSYDSIPLDSLGLHPYLRSYSRINAEGERTNNPDSLPVGFARAENWVDHATGTSFDAMGFTCAACHTGQVDWVSDSGTVRVRIEGGPATVDLGKFRTAFGISLALTSLLPGRFDRFAERVHQRAEGDSLPDVAITREEKARLRESFDELLERGGELRTLQDSLAIYPTEEGFSRLDATGRAANFILGASLGQSGNYQVADGPVNFPHIWDAPWFEWVQYNASFQQPMMRNAAEGLGVFAAVDLKGAGPRVPASEDPLLLSSSMDVITIHEMEKLISGPGDEPFTGLTSPRWPTAFPPIDPDRRDRGAALYAVRCAGCHLPGSDEPEKFYDDVNWTPEEHGRRYLKMHVSDLWEIGTDPLTAANFRNRTVDFGPLGERLGLQPRSYRYSEALSLMVGAVQESRYRALGIPDTPVFDSVRLELDGYRGPQTRDTLAYRARPLNGIWATPPFLHNGSVPTLYLLLGPQDERPGRFWLGSRRFDPVHIGFDYSEAPGAFEFDTSLPGNSNKGHLFEGDPTDWDLQGRMGVVGPGLTPEQRLDVIEYLKSLPPLPTR